MAIHQLDIIIPLNVVIVSVNHFKKETYFRNTIENKDNFSPVDFYGTNGWKLMDNAIQIGIDKQSVSLQSVSKYIHTCIKPRSRIKQLVT